MIFLVYCIVSLFYYVSVVSWPTTNMARYSLFVSESAVKHQANKQTKLSHEKKKLLHNYFTGWSESCVSLSLSTLPSSFLRERH